MDDAQWTPDNKFVLILLRGASASNAIGKQDFENPRQSNTKSSSRLSYIQRRCRQIFTENWKWCKLNDYQPITL